MNKLVIKNLCKNLISDIVIFCKKTLDITLNSLNFAPNLVATVDDPVVVAVHEKKRGRPKLAKAALKFDKLQEIEKLKPIEVRRTSNRNSKKTMIE